MLLLNCPNCGPRNVGEFRHGGETNPRPKDPAATGEAEWTDYLYMRSNVSGVQTEWWHHRYGCGLWFLAERHTYTNEVLRTYVWQPKGEEVHAGATSAADLARTSREPAPAQGTDPAAEG